MKYIELAVACADSTESEITTALLSDFPFDSFAEEQGWLKAYIREDDFRSNREEIERYLGQSGRKYELTEIPDRNWNTLWESNFEPIRIDSRCRIRAPFHAADPSFEYEIEIMPKMSFGTGHHATTRLMAAESLDSDFREQRGLDMGSGTAVLAILAAMKGAAHVDAIDIDPWSYTNGTENVAANGVSDRVTPALGDATLLRGRSYDFVLANINRNILLADMEAYAHTLSPGGTLIVSGILEADTGILCDKAHGLGFGDGRVRTHDGWAAIRFTKR